MGADANHRSKAKGGRFVRLDHALLASCAYRAASPNARALLVELAMMDNGRNNGELFLSVRDAADRMGVTDHHAARAALDELERLGFIEMTADAHFAVKASDGSRARCWRLTWLAVPAKSRPATHDYRTAQPTDKRGKKRLAIGRKVLETFQRKQMPVVESTTRFGQSVVETTTTTGNVSNNERVSVVESTTLKVETPLVSANRRCSGIHHTYSLPAIGAADRQSGQVKQTSVSLNSNNDTIAADASLDDLREHLISYLATAPCGAQARLAEAAGIPKGTLSKFKDGRHLAPHHVASLRRALIKQTRKEVA